VTYAGRLLLFPRLHLVCVVSLIDLTLCAQSMPGSTHTGTVIPVSLNLKSAKQYKLIDHISYRNFLHRIFPARVPSESPNREDISTLRLVVQLPIHYLDRVLLKTIVCVKVPNHLTTPPLRILRGSDRKLEPSPAVAIRAVVFLVARPPLVLGDDGDHDFPQRLALRDRPRDEISNAVVANGDMLLASVDDFNSRPWLLNWLAFSD